MGKRIALGVLVLVTGLLLATAATTAPIGLVLVAGGSYLLALPHLGRIRGVLGRVRGNHRST